MEFVSIRKGSQSRSYVKGGKIFVNLKTQCLDLNALRLENLEDVVGLEKLISLYRLELQGNELTKIDDLGTLRDLHELFLSSNKIIEIENLDSLTNLERLTLGDNKISHIQGLDNLVKLRELDL